MYHKIAARTVLSDQNEIRYFKACSNECTDVLVLQFCHLKCFAHDVTHSQLLN